MLVYILGEGLLGGLFSNKLSDLVRQSHRLDINHVCRRRGSNSAATT